MIKDSGPSAPDEAAQYTAATRWASSTFILLICALFVIAGLTLVYLSLSVDSRQVEHSEADAARALDSRQDKIGTALADYAFWSDAYNFTLGDVDLQWAFERDNIGPSLFGTYGLDGVFILGPAGGTRYSILAGELSDTAANDWIVGDLPALLAKARQAAAEDDVAYAYLSVEGRPAVVSAAVIRPDSSYDQFDQLSYLLYIDVLTATKLKAIEEAFDLRDLIATLGVPSDAERPMLSRQNDVGYAVTLQWESEALGRAILSKFLPMLFLLGALVAWLVYSLRNRIVRSSRMIEEAQAALRVSEQRFKNISEASSDWIWETDADQNLIYFSERFHQLTGLAPADWLGRPLGELLTYDQSLFTSTAEHCSVSGRRPIPCEMIDSETRRHYCQLSVRAVRIGGQLQGYQGTVCDITEEIKAKARIEHISHHDALTGLANRHRLNQYLSAQLKEGVCSDRPLFLLALDLDRFKPINDTFGHAAGDLVLRAVAKAITGCIRETDLVARLGGDEFIVVATDCRTYEHAERLCQRLIERINQPIRIEGNDVSVGTSIGIVAAPFDGLNSDDLLRYADIALYEAKSCGRNLFRFYEPAMNERIKQRRQMEMDMRQALRRREFRLDFQPRCDSSSQTMLGAEALVRWQHPTKGLLNPLTFIPLAEETGLIVELSDWVMREACLTAMSWDEQLLISVDLSPVEFQRNDLVDRVAAVIAETGIAPHRLELEITESVMLEDAASALVAMNQLKALGVRLTMDDFGTGYSSLSYLRNYPFDGIKIDRSFIAGLDQSESSMAIVNAIISMGHALSLTVTAEGIESAEHLGKIVELTCDQAQGFYLGRPVSAKLFKQMFIEHQAN